MILIINHCTEPYFNMACEEYLLRISREPTVMLWRNEPAVIIGKNQNAGENVDFAFTEKHNIKVVRRLTGGGTVFHDLGNINYTFIVPESEAPESFSDFSLPVIQALSALGIKAEANGRNDLTADGKKFSGTARCGYIYNERKMIMHHGTLLFSSDMSELSGALITDAGKIKSKGIKSTAARVVNLKTLLPEKYSGMDAGAFLKYLEDYFIKNKNAVPRGFSSEEQSEISSLAKEKYASEKWLLRAGAEELDTVSRKRFDFGTLIISVSCAPGEVGFPAKILKIRIEGDFIGDDDISGLEALLTGIDFEKKSLLCRLNGVNVIKYIRGCNPSDFVSVLFG